MDKRVIFLPAAWHIKRALLACGLSLLLGACAVTGREEADSAEAQADQLESEAAFHIATAERLVNIGEYESALEEYLAAARTSSEPQIARMVTRLAGQLENWPAAINAAERWLELEPDAESAHHILIIARVNLGQADLAVEALADWLEEEGSPESSGWWQQGAIVLAAAGNGESARNVFDRLVDKHGSRATPGAIAYAESILLWRQGAYDRSIEKAQTAAEASGETEHLVWAAQLAVDSGDLEQALTLYRQASAQNPDDQTLALSQAEVLRQLERNEEVIELLRSLPENSETLYSLGVYLAELGRESQAQSVWQQLRDLPEADRREDHALLVAQLAEIVGRDEAALAWYDRVDDPDRKHESTLRKAIVLGRLGHIEAARTILAGLREQGDESLLLDSWLIEAEMLRSNGRESEAVAILHQPLADHPGNVDLLYARALSAASAGNVELAEQDFRRIIQMDGENAVALNALGYTLTDRTDRHEEAYRLIQRALELDPEDPATLDSMGWVLHRLGRSEEAVDYLRQALEGDENPEIMAHLIEVLDHIGQNSEAARLADSALEQYPEDSYLRDTLERLGRLQ